MAAEQAAVIVFPSALRGNRIITAFAQRIAAQNAPYRQNASLHRAVGEQRLHGIFAAGGKKTAIGAQMGRDVFLIPLYG